MKDQISEVACVTGMTGVIVVVVVNEAHEITNIYSQKHQIMNFSQRADLK